MNAPSGDGRSSRAARSLRRLRAFDGAQALQLVGIVAAVVLAFVVNIVAARHFARWDWTRDGRWTLSPATVETLRGLDAPVDVWAIAGPGDPFEGSLRQLLTTYAAESPRIDVHWIDPDRDTVQLVDLTRKFDLQAGRAENGRIATDAVVIVASGDKHWFLTPSDLVDQTDDARVKPREERALTQALRSVRDGTKAKLCFTAGHGEMSLEDAESAKGENDSLAGVRELLEKDNYDVASVDTAAPDAHEPFSGCSVVVVAGPSSAFAPEEANRLRTWLLHGGALLAALGPTESSAPSGLGTTGLDEALSPFGIGLDDDLVHDLDPAVAIPDTHGEGFFVSARPHPVTASLTAGADAHPPRTALFYARSLRHVGTAGAAWATELLSTTPGAFAKKSIIGASTWNDAPPRDPSDVAGPFILAMASERTRVEGASHPPRAVVVGSRFVLSDDNWRQPHALHGAAFFVDSAISWLAARPSVVDVPERAEISSAIRVSEEGREEVRRYVLMLMPAAAILLGIAVWAWRRSSENAPYSLAPREEPEEPIS